MQTALTPWNQPSLPLACSEVMNLWRPRLPLSSIPSKTKRRFTGSSSFKSLCASRTLSHPKTGPLSSDDPRPMSWPLSAMVKVNGSVFQPSLSRAWFKTFNSGGSGFHLQLQRLRVGRQNGRKLGSSFSLGLRRSFLRLRGAVVFRDHLWFRCRDLPALSGRPGPSADPP